MSEAMQPTADVPAEDKNARHRERVLSEIRSSERTYVADLEAAITTYMEPLQKSAEDHDLDDAIAAMQPIQSSLVQIRSFHQILLAHFDKAAGPSDFAETFIKYSDFFKMYTAYINNYDATMDAVALLRSSKKLNAILDAGRDLVRGRDITSFLITPIQRIPRYELLLREVLKHTEDAADCESLEFALERVQDIAITINEAKRQAERKSKLMELAGTLLDLDKELKGPLLEAHRQFVMEGPLIDVMKRKVRHCYLFNDMFIWTSLPKNRVKGIVRLGESVFTAHERDASAAKRFSLDDVQSLFPDMVLPQPGSPETYARAGGLDSPMGGDSLDLLPSPSVPGADGADGDDGSPCSPDADDNEASVSACGTPGRAGRSLSGSRPGSRSGSRAPSRSGSRASSRAPSLSRGSRAASPAPAPAAMADVSLHVEFTWTPSAAGRPIGRPQMLRLAAAGEEDKADWVEAVTDAMRELAWLKPGLMPHGRPSAEEDAPVSGSRRRQSMGAVGMMKSPRRFSFGGAGPGAQALPLCAPALTSSASGSSAAAAAAPPAVPTSARPPSATHSRPGTPSRSMRNIQTATVPASAVASALVAGPSFGSISIGSELQSPTNAVPLAASASATASVAAPVVASAPRVGSRLPRGSVSGASASAASASAAAAAAPSIPARPGRRALLASGLATGSALGGSTGFSTRGNVGVSAGGHGHGHRKQMSITSISSRSPEPLSPAAHAARVAAFPPGSPSSPSGFATRSGPGAITTGGNSSGAVGASGMSPDALARSIAGLNFDETISPRNGTAKPALPRRRSMALRSPTGAARSLRSPSNMVSPRNGRGPASPAGGSGRGRGRGRGFTFGQNSPPGAGNSSVSPAPGSPHPSAFAEKHIGAGDDLDDMLAGEGVGIGGENRKNRRRSGCNQQ